MKPVLLKFCPQCGSMAYKYCQQKYWHCPECQFTYYHNVAASASVILTYGNSVLMLERAKDPGRGLLSLPGGFIDAGERAEDAAIRECLEETGLSSLITSFVGSWPNEYEYKNVTYYTCDFYFSAKLLDSSATISLDACESSGFCLLPLCEIASAPIAFESHRKALLAWCSLA